MLLGRWLPEFDVSKRHAARIRAGREAVFGALLRYDFATSLSTRVLLALRGYGRRASRPKGEAPADLREALVRFGFTLLAEEPGRELVFGLVGRFWRPTGDLRAVPATDFAAFHEPGYAKAAWNLLVEEEGPGVTRLSTETRVQCFGEDARRKFLLYWRLVEPFSGVIRRSLLRGVRRVAERPPTSCGCT